MIVPIECEFRSISESVSARRIRCFHFSHRLLSHALWLVGHSGVIFDEELKDQPYPQRTALLRGKVLADYLRTLQEKQMTKP